MLYLCVSVLCIYRGEGEGVVEGDATTNSIVSSVSSLTLVALYIAAVVLTVEHHPNPCP